MKQQGTHRDYAAAANRASLWCPSAHFYPPRDQIAFRVRKDTRKGRIPDVTRFFLHTRGINCAHDSQGRSLRYAVDAQ
jgi:hypothetical protein